MARLSLAYLAALRGVFCADARVITHQAFVGRAPSASRVISKSRVRMPSWLPIVAPRYRRVRGYYSPADGGGNIDGGNGGNRTGKGPSAGKGLADDKSPLGIGEDHMVSAVSGNGQVVARAVTARNLVQEALVRQDLHPLGADALGRVMICTMLMAGGLKHQETFQLTFSGSGPLGGVVAISDGESGVRGYVTNGQVDLPLKENGNQNVAAGIGQGLLKVVRNHPDYVRPYTGITSLKTGEVAYDAASYLAESEQKSCAIAVGCFVTGALVRQAGGYMLETLPDASEETEKTVVTNISKLLSRAEDPSELLGRGLTPVGMVEALLDGLGGVGALTYKRPSFLCHCSDERVYRALSLLAKEEVEDILQKKETIEVKCEFCGKEYRLSAEDLAEDLRLRRSSREDPQ